MKQTAMQEHIEWLKATIEIAEEQAPSLVNVLKLCLNDAKQKLTMEKEQMRDAFNSGMNDSVDYFIPFLNPNDESENYYNKTFKSE